MSEFLERITKLSPQRLALLAVQLNTTLEQLRQQTTEPLAIIGLACRFPGGAVDAQSFWRILHEGRDVVSVVPRDRWDIDALYDPNPDAPGKMCTRWGGFLDNIDQFDPQFFGISPREAAGMDPQQRLLLEVAWEALENAGQSPERLAATRTGVFAGLCTGDYHALRLAGGPGSIDAYVATGNAHSVASGRISYVIGLQGPCISIDTACSSSLVAVHLACQSLRLRECNLALAGGANLVLAPDTTITLSKSHMMSPDGRCKAFDASANGFVRAEGCGLVVLKRLSDARRDGDRILAVIRGSACNQDGASSGLTAPNGPSQMAVIQDALANAGLKPEDVDYVEAHGTGTSLGDPIEARALADVFGPGREATVPLRVGSVKTNMGHAESAAGIAGLIKAVLALQHAKIPPSLHFNQLNPHIEWDGVPIQVPTTPLEWSRPRGQRIAGVSSFGFGGTNAHIVLGDVAEGSSADGMPEGPVLVPLSARSSSALSELAAAVDAALKANPAVSPAAIVRTLGRGRNHFEHRLAVRGSSVAELREGLAAARRGESHARLRGGATGNAPLPGVVFLFTGQGSQYPDMGRKLYESQPVFRRELERCAEILQPLLDRPLLDLLYGNSGVLEQTQYTQPALFAIEYALAELWRSWGVEPSIVLGHSVGEYVAACVAGVFSLEDGLRLIAARGKLMASLPAGGAMLSVFADEARVAAAVAPHAATVAIACRNGPTNFVISGAREGVQAVADTLAHDGVKSRALAVSHAFHSPLMDPILAQFESVAQSITYTTPRIAIVSNVTGTIAELDVMTNAAYWRRHVREAVRFSDSIRAVRAAGKTVFLEIGPHPVLAGMARQTATEDNLTWASSLVRDRNDWDSLLDGAATLYVRGVNLRWEHLPAEQTARPVALPTYPFQRSRYWLDPVQPARGAAQRPAGAHPFLGDRLDSPAIVGAAFDLELGANRPAFLDDHRIFGRLIMPSPAYIEMAIAGLDARDQRPFADTLPCEILDLSIREPLFLPDEGTSRIQLLLDEPAEDATAFRVCSREAGAAWRTHVTGRVRHGASAESPVPASLADIQRRCATETSAEAFYESIVALGLDFGERFRGITRIWRGQHEALGRLELPAALLGDAKPYRIHPALLDACFHLLGAALPETSPANAFLLIGIDQFRLLRLPPAKFWNHTVLRPSADLRTEAFVGDIWLLDDSGALLAEIKGLQLRRATREALERASNAAPATGPEGWFYELAWRTQPRSTQPGASNGPALAADFVPAPATLGRPVGDELRALAGREYADVYDRFIPAVESLAAQFIVRAFVRLGWKPAAGERVAAADLAARLGVVPGHRRLFARMLAILAEDGWLRRDGDGWVVARALEAPAADLQATATTLRAEFPTCAAEVILTARCAEPLDLVLRGKADPLQLLFPNGEFDLADDLYRRAPFARTMNGAAAFALRQILAAAPAGRTLRILEIGAGTGGTSATLIPQLPPERARYTFTDVSPAFLSRARDEFKAFPFVDFALLDIEKAPATQGWAGRQFDVVVAANVLHATRNLRETVGYAASLLAPGGMLVLLEGTSPRRWVDLTFGLTDGWWRFNDTDLRPDYALISNATWLRVLEGLGLDAVQLAASNDERSPRAHQALLLARKPTPAVAAASTTAPQTNAHWILLADQHGFAAATAERLRARGDDAVLVTADSSFVRTSTGAFTIDPGAAADFARVLTDVQGSRRTTLRGVVNFSPVDAQVGDHASADAWTDVESRLNRAALLLAQAFVQANTSNASGSGARLWFVTRGAQAITQGSAATPETFAPVQANIWGLARGLSLEHPALFGAVLDLDPIATLADAVTAVVDEIQGDAAEDAVAWRGGSRLLPRVARFPSTPAPHTLQPRRDGSYLVTGGLGGLGLALARRLARRGAGHIVLLSRREFPARERWASLPATDAWAAQVQAVLEIERSGARVTVARGDVASETDMRALFQRFGAEWPALRGVIHAAVDMTSAPLAEMSFETFAAMCRAKTRGAWILHELTHKLPLDCFVLFSSTTALWGVAGLAHYAAANQALDTLAAQRRAQGLPALAINWGTWQEMRVATEDDKRRFAQSGLRPMETELALDALERALGAGLGAAIVAGIDWPVLRGVYETRRARPIFAEVTRSVPGAPTRAVKTKTQAETANFVDKLRAAAPGRRRDLLVGHVRALAGAVLGFDAKREIPLDQGLFDMGMDSLMSVELKGRLERSLGVPLPSTLTFNYPTVGALVDFLLAEALSLETTDAPTTPASTPATPASRATEAPPPVTDDLSEDDLEQALLKRLEKL